MSVKVLLSFWYFLIFPHSQTWPQPPPEMNHKAGSNRIWKKPKSADLISSNAPPTKRCYKSWGWLRQCKTKSSEFLETRRIFIFDPSSAVGIRIQILDWRQWTPLLTMYYMN